MATFALIMSTPRYDSSTDGYIGESRTIIAEFDQLDSAVKAQQDKYAEYAADYYDDYDPDLPSFLIAMWDANGHASRWADYYYLTPNSYYTGPDTTWNTVPF